MEKNHETCQRKSTGMMIYHQFDPSCWNFSLDCFILQVGLGSDHYDV